MPDIARAAVGRLVGSQVHPVCRAPDTRGPAVQNVRVDHGRADVAVTEELLDGSDIPVVLEQVGES
jgi:hypothetical protein